MFFNRVDQLWNADWLRDQWMPLDMKSALRLIVRDQRCQENYRRIVQLTIVLDLCRYLASVHFRHDDVEQDQVRFKIVRCLISFGGIVLLEDEIRAGSFQKNLYKMRAVSIVIDDQNPSFFFGC